MDFKSLLLNFNGRIRRQHFWLGLVGVMVVGYVLILFAAPALQKVNTMLGSIFALIVAVAWTWAALAIYWKRMHDLDKTGWMSLIPIYNIIYAGFFPGTVGPNKYGPDPKGGTAPATA